MAKKFQIDLQLDTSQADASTNRMVAALGKVDKAAERTAAAAERRAQREAAALDRIAERAVRAADRKADAEAKAAEKAARQRQLIEDRILVRENARGIAAARNTQREADAKVAANEKAARQRQLIEDRMLARENSRAIASERAAQREADGKVRAKERESRQLRAIEDRFLKAEHDRQVATAKESANALEALRASGKSGGFGAGLTEIMSGVNLARQGLGFVQGIVAGFEAVDNSVIRSAGFVTDYRESLMELAALKGKLGGSDEAMKEELAFRSKTGMTQDAARAFQGAALGVGQSSVDNAMRQSLISQEDWTRLMVMGGKFQSVEGGDAKAHGELLGIIPQMIGRRTTAEEVFAKEQQLYNIFQPGGASFSSMSSQFARLTPLIKGGIYKDTEAGALMSAFSTIAPQSAETMVQQFTRGTVGGLGRLRGAAIEGDSEKQGTYLRRIGATNQMDPIAIGRLISEDFTRQEAIEKAAGRKFNPLDYLRHKGYGNQEDVNALVAFHGMRGEIERSFMPLAADAAIPKTADVMRTIDTAQAVDPVFQRRKGALAGTFSQVFAGAGAPEHYAALSEAAFARAQMGAGTQRVGLPGIGGGGLVGSALGLLGQAIGGSALAQFSTFGAGTYEEQTAATPFGALAIDATRDTMKQMLSERGAQVGLDPFSFGAGSVTMKQRAEDVWVYEQEVARRGGQIGVDTSKLEEIANRQLEESKALRRAFEQGQRGDGMGRAPDGVPPRAGAIRP